LKSKIVNLQDDKSRSRKRIGIAVIAFIYGVLISFFKNIINRIKYNYIRTMVYSYISVNIIVLSVLYGDTNHLVLRTFSFIFSSILFILIYNLKTNYK